LAPLHIIHKQRMAHLLLINPSLHSKVCTDPYHFEAFYLSPASSK
jgi:hypothetical protein